MEKYGNSLIPESSTNDGSELTWQLHQISQEIKTTRSQKLSREERTALFEQRDTIISDILHYWYKTPTSPQPKNLSMWKKDFASESSLEAIPLPDDYPFTSLREGTMGILYNLRFGFRDTTSYEIPLIQAAAIYALHEPEFTRYQEPYRRLFKSLNPYFRDFKTVPDKSPQEVVEELLFQYRQLENIMRSFAKKTNLNELPDNEETSATRKFLGECLAATVVSTLAVIETTSPETYHHLQITCEKMKYDTTVYKFIINNIPPFTTHTPSKLEVHIPNDKETCHYLENRVTIKK